MRRCLFLAQKGLGTVAPNPMVGAVIVVDNQIIGEGYTSPFGGPHAEVNAIEQVKDASLLQRATLYVSLEPCAHFGKTPPCSHLITRMKIPKVVIGTTDSFSKVNGLGIQHLQENGIEVITGILEKECRELNKRFFTFHEKKRPYIILKWAESKDGFMDRDRLSDEKGVYWITAPETQVLVHLWRSQEMGILVGKNTIENDNPRLDVRRAHGKNPTRIVLAPNADLDLQKWESAFEIPTFVFTTKRSEKIGNLEFIALPEYSLTNVLNELHARDIQSILVEGGSYTLEQFIQNNLWDEARILTGDIQFKSGISAPDRKGFSLLKSEAIGKDTYHLFQNENSHFF